MFVNVEVIYHAKDYFEKILVRVQLNKKQSAMQGNLALRFCSCLNFVIV